MIRARGNPDRRADNASAVTTGAQRQATKAGIGFAAMHNAFAAVDDSAGLQAIWTVWDRRRFRRCWTSGWRCCRTRSVKPTGKAGYR